MDKFNAMKSFLVLGDLMNDDKATLKDKAK